MPFDTERLGMRVDSVSVNKFNSDGEEVQTLKVSLVVSPLTRELADDLSAFMRRTLFTANDAAVNQQLTRAQFDICHIPQEIEVRMAPDQDEPSFVIGEAKVGPLKVSRGLRSTGWDLRFDIEFAPESEHQLAQVCDSHAKMRFLSFSNAEADLFSESKKVERTARKADAQHVAEHVAAEARVN